MEFPCFYPDSEEQSILKNRYGKEQYIQSNIEEEENEESTGFRSTESQYFSQNTNNEQLLEIENTDESAESRAKQGKQLKVIDKKNSSEENKQLAFVKKEMGYISFKFNKSILTKEFYHLCYDFFILADLFGRNIDDVDGDQLAFEHMSKLCLIRPTSTYMKYNNFTAYLLEITETGLQDHTIAINRLVNAQHITAYNVANRLQELQNVFQEMYNFSKKLKSIYNWEKVREDLNRNYENSFEKALQYIKKILNLENQYISFVIRRICPQTLTEKYCANIASDALVNLISNNKLQEANIFFIRKCFPNILDMRSLQEMMYKFSFDEITLQSVVTCLDGEQLPCQLHLSKINLCGYEICPGVTLYDSMIIFNYQFNPNIIKALEEKRTKSSFKIDTFDFRYSAVSEIFQDKFYK
ncbi:hypothetical protein TTHERM_00277460 (macronuclear) [Tetrahymena thermophila SB210]|uniref:Uncharacterized protein n=1 Tax=Tetrahymena thermophila (strain SB210) TaxID=312017 RepID=I7LVC4_TETTS|nr:hypothetical protein TTHERM_00277460 [Tetrahymena thermophila SB210]EAR97859.1 hypothetical protein TTHERM_00277460 [Tetrahymena thermophila SB210]|eukprot:XP_001018104.1 hypothetical protein TTHERM_00277460 [Tetrahymena thermophila SB210]